MERIINLHKNKILKSDITRDYEYYNCDKYNYLYIKNNIEKNKLNKLAEQIDKLFIKNNIFEIVIKKIKDTTASIYRDTILYIIDSVSIFESKILSKEELELYNINTGSKFKHILINDPVSILLDAKIGDFIMTKIPTSNVGFIDDIREVV